MYVKLPRDGIFKPLQRLVIMLYVRYIVESDDDILRKKMAEVMFD